MGGVKERATALWIGGGALSKDAPDAAERFEIAGEGDIGPGARN